jgi:hypothetical protein
MSAGPLEDRTVHTRVLAQSGHESQAVECTSKQISTLEVNFPIVLSPRCQPSCDALRPCQRVVGACRDSPRELPKPATHLHAGRRDTTQHREQRLGQEQSL